MSFRFICVHKLKQSYFVRWFSIHAVNLDSNELILTIQAEFYMIISTMTLFSNWEVTMLCETFNSNYMHASWTFSFAKWIDIIESDFSKTLVWVWHQCFQNHIRLSLIKYQKNMFECISRHILIATF